jgi:DNA-binding NarL/FixJ family response regulator
MHKKFKNILLIEDNYEIGLIFRYYIVNQPDMLLIDVVSDAEEAIKKMETQCPDIFIIDINHLERQGLSLIEHINSIKHAIRPKLIAISFEENEEMNQKAQKLGAQCFLFPNKFRDLFDWIRDN